MARRQLATPSPLSAAPFTKTSIGKKALMAVTGAVLVLFVIGHLLGNLQIYLGQTAINAYAETLESMPVVVWGTRFILLFSVSVHLLAAVETTMQSLRGRKTRYHSPRNYQRATWASRSMRITGPLLLIYLLYHLMHLTFGNAHPDFVHGDIYHNLVSGFSHPFTAAAYIVAMLALGGHLLHGIWSLFQTLGANSSAWSQRFRTIATVVTVLIVLGNISIPIAILSGFIH